MSNLIAAVIVAVCLPQSDHCELEVPHVWQQPDAQDLHQCATKAEGLILMGVDAHCEVAYSYPLPGQYQPVIEPRDVEDTPIRNLADRQEVEEYLAPLRD